jgi:hypothetical protein
MPKYTKPILEALDKFCTKATFFSVGQMASAYPDMVKEVIGRGHTLGTHTWSHPMNLRALSFAKAEDQLERGFAAVALAAGQPIAPFFRFPGLSDSGPLLEHLSIAASPPSPSTWCQRQPHHSPQRLAQRTIDLLEKQNGGIVLFHDIKASTAAALPNILAELKKRGFKIVHMRSKTTFEPLPAMTAELEAKREKSEAKKTANGEVAKPKLVPFYAAIAPSTLEAAGEPAVTELAPDARERVHAGGTHATASAPVVTSEAVDSAHPLHHGRAKHRGHRRGRVAGSGSASLSHVVSGGSEPSAQRQS